MAKNNPSPYYQTAESIATFKLRLLQHIELLRMPIAQQHNGACARDCHLLERNHTLEVIKNFVQNIRD